MADFSLPSPELLRRQAAWLSAARSRLLRRGHIARRRRVLELGSAFGAVTGELARRCGGMLVALDRRRDVLLDVAAPLDRVARVCGDAASLPFAPQTFDLVFSQFTILWANAAKASREIVRILQPGGVLVALEPDYGGMIEHPPQVATREIWMEALARAGADPQTGRKLPGLLAAAGLEVRVDLLDRLEPPSPARYAMLAELPLSEQEREDLRRVEAAEPDCPETTLVAHLPVFLITAEKPAAGL